MLGLGKAAMWIIYSLLSALFSALCAILQKKALFKIGAFDLSFALYFFEAFIFLAAAIIFGTTFAGISNNALGFIFVKAVLNVTSFVLIMNGMKRLELSAGLPLMLLSPAIVAIAAYLLLGEMLTVKESGGIVMILIGAYLLEFKSPSEMLLPFKKIITHRGYFFMFSAVAIITGSVLLNRYILVAKGIKPLAFASIEHLMALPIIFIAALLFKRPLFQLKASFKSMPFIIFAAAFGTVLYRLFEVMATAQANVALVVALKRLSVVMAVIIGGKLFKEENRAKRIAATVIMFIGAALVAGI